MPRYFLFMFTEYRIAPIPEGPGFPEHAPSVKMEMAAFVALSSKGALPGLDVIFFSPQGSRFGPMVSNWIGSVVSSPFS